MQLIEQREVNRSVEDCYAYLLDFSSVKEWDPGVKNAHRISRGKIGLGSTFFVECYLPLGTIDLSYEIVELQPLSMIRLIGSSKAFTVDDEIRFEAVDGEPNRTRIIYQATFTFGAAVASFASMADSSMQKMGRAALDGLERALNDEFDVPKLGSLASVADKMVLPGMASFSAAGFKQASKNFEPISRNMHGKHVVVTGASSGIGYAAALRLAERGASLTLVMRNKQKAKDTVSELKRLTGNNTIKAEIADLSLLSDTAALIRRLKRRAEPIDALVNNAGALFDEQRDTDEGIDESLALLLLSPFQLMCGLKTLLIKANDARVVNVVSGGLYTQKLRISKLFAPDPSDYSGSVAYALAKRALMIATEELAQSWQEEGIAVNAMHPGWADTPGVEDSLPGFYKLTKKILRTPEEGADSIDWAVCATEASGLSGQLILDRAPRERYLIPGTRETHGQRNRLMQALEECTTAKDVLRFNGVNDPLPA